MSEIAHRESLDEGKNPLKLLPLDFIGPATFFHGFYSDILKGKLGLVTRLRWWISEYNLTPTECNRVMKKLMRPAESAKYQYAGQMFAEMAREIDEMLKERKAAAEREEQRATAERHKQEAAPADEVRALLRGIGRG